jgi:hypothetical protein
MRPVRELDVTVLLDGVWGCPADGAAGVQSRPPSRAPRASLVSARAAEVLYRLSRRGVA